MTLFVAPFLLAFVVFVLLTGFGRWLAGLPFGRRGFREILLAPDDPATLRYARAAGASLGWYLGAVTLFTIGGACGGQTVVDETTMRVSVAQNGPAYAVGIRNGDRVISVGGVAIGDWDQLKKEVASHRGEAVRVVVERSREQLDFDPVPNEQGKIMIGPFSEVRSLGLGGALAQGLSAPLLVNAATFKSLVRMSSGSDKPELSGPVEIVKETNAAQRHGPGPFFRLLAALASYVMPVIVLVWLVIAFATGYRKTS